jgi:hypothetical protein
MLSMILSLVNGIDSLGARFLTRLPTTLILSSLLWLGTTLVPIVQVHSVTWQHYSHSIILIIVIIIITVVIVVTSIVIINQHTSPFRQESNKSFASTAPRIAGRNGQSGTRLSFLPYHQAFESLFHEKDIPASERVLVMSGVCHCCECVLCPGFLGACWGSHDGVHYHFGVGHVPWPACHSLSLLTWKFTIPFLLLCTVFCPCSCFAAGGYDMDPTPRTPGLNR